VLALDLDRTGFRPVEPSIRKQGAAPLVTFGETAALLARPPAPGSRSRGSTLYLNTTLLDYPQARTQGEGEDLRQLVRNLLRVVDLEPQVRVVEAETGRDLPLVGKRLTVPLEDIESVREAGNMYGKGFLWKRAFLLKAPQNKRIGFAVAPSAASRWRDRLCPGGRGHV